MTPTQRKIEFFVPGIPRPGGSKRPFRTKFGKMVVVEAGKHTKDWRASVALAGSEAYRGELLTGALRFDVMFLFPRPKSHYRTGQYSDQLKPSAPHHHITKPDRTKLLRSTEDALTGIIWRDDCIVTCGQVSKRYVAEPAEYGKPGALITITLEDLG